MLRPPLAYVRWQCIENQCGLYGLMGSVVLFIRKGGVADCIHYPHLACIQVISLYGAIASAYGLVMLSFVYLTFLCVCIIITEHAQYMCG